MENLYSQLKMFHFPEKLQALERGIITPPVHIRLKPINACNHHCFFCCYRMDGLYLSENFNVKDMIPREKMREIVADIAAGGVRAVTFTGGGEPLIYPHIVETFRGLIDRSVKVAVLSNGARLHGEVAEVLGDGAAWVRVSIDAADGETLAQSRSVKPGEFAEIVNNLRDFSRTKRRQCELGINYIVTQLNADHTYEFIALMKDCGVDHVKVSECIVSTKGVENTMYHAPHAEKVRAETQRAQEDLADDSFRVFDKFHHFEDDFDKGYHVCPFIQFLNVIGANQIVYSCQDKAYTESGALGSIKQRSLLELWSSDEYRRRIRGLDPSKVCDHHCVQHEKNLSLLNYLSSDREHLEFV